MHSSLFWEFAFSQSLIESPNRRFCHSFNFLFFIRQFYLTFSHSIRITVSFALQASFNHFSIQFSHCVHIQTSKHWALCALFMVHICWVSFSSYTYKMMHRIFFSILPFVRSEKKIRRFLLCIFCLFVFHLNWLYLGVEYIFCPPDDRNIFVCTSPFANPWQLFTFSIVPNRYPYAWLNSFRFGIGRLSLTLNDWAIQCRV